MIALLLYRMLADSPLPWFLKFTARMLARCLNMPEPLVQSTGDFVVAQIVAQVLAFEHGAGKSLCPFRLAARFRAWWRGLR